MSKWTDAIELAKAGFKAGEIKKLWEEKENEPEPQREETTQTPEEKTDPAGGIQEQDPGPDPKQDPPAEDPQPDLKYQELENKYNDLLKKYQQNNVRQDISDKSEKTVEEAARDVLAAMIGG